MRKKLDLDKYIKKALKICNNYDEINTHSLQRKLRLGYYHAIKIYKHLKERKIIKKERINKTPFGRVKVGIIDKDRLREVYYN